jgi:hypothetical protein
MDQTMKTLNSQTPNSLPGLFFVLGFRFLLNLYWLTRLGGSWIEDDTSRTTAAAEGVLRSGELASQNFRLYTNGFLYEVYTPVYSLLSGMSIVDLQRWVFPFTSMLVVFLAYVFYLRIFQNPTTAAIACVLLNLQGDFIFTTLRGTHEKLDYILIFASFLLLALSVKWFDSFRERIALAIIYYLIILAQNTDNVFFASTFTTTLMLSFVFWWIISKFLNQKIPGSLWTFYIALVSSVFIFIVVFVWYPPARSVVLAASDIGERVRLFLFSATEAPADLLNLARSNWIFPNAWFVLRIYDILLMLIAGFGWIHLLLNLRKKNSTEVSPLKTNYFWLIILLPSFALQNAVVVFTDLTGSAGDINNLQIRLIPLTAFLAAPTVAYVLFLFFKWVKHLAPQTQSVIFIIITVSSSVFMGLGLIKGTSEPLLANTWFFYSPAEYNGINWLNNKELILGFDFGRRTPRIWAGDDFRLGGLWLNDLWNASRAPIPVSGNIKDPYSLIFISPLTRLSAERGGISMPDLQDTNLVYDNGEVKIYFRPIESR